VDPGACCGRPAFAGPRRLGATLRLPRGPTSDRTVPRRAWALLPFAGSSRSNAIVVRACVIVSSAAVVGASGIKLLSASRDGASALRSWPRLGIGLALLTGFVSRTFAAWGTRWGRGACRAVSVGARRPRWPGRTVGGGVQSASLAAIAAAAESTRSGPPRHRGPIWVTILLAHATAGGDPSTPVRGLAGHRIRTLSRQWPRGPVTHTRTSCVVGYVASTRRFRRTVVIVALRGRGYHSRQPPITRPHDASSVARTRVLHHTRVAGRSIAAVSVGATIVTRRRLWRLH
jgi:hypothetical protein